MPRASGGLCLDHPGNGAATTQDSVRRRRSKRARRNAVNTQIRIAFANRPSETTSAARSANPWLRSRSRRASDQGGRTGSRQPEGRFARSDEAQQPPRSPREQSTRPAATRRGDRAAAGDGWTCRNCAVRAAVAREQFHTQCKSLGILSRAAHTMAAAIRLDPGGARPVSAVVERRKNFRHPVDEQPGPGTQMPVARIEHVKRLPRTAPVVEHGAKPSALEVRRDHELERLPQADAREQRAQVGRSSR